jgi:hypothetical protein
MTSADRQALLKTYQNYQRIFKRSFVDLTHEENKEKNDTERASSNTASSNKRMKQNHSKTSGTKKPPTPIKYRFNGRKQRRSNSSTHAIWWLLCFYNKRLRTHYGTKL